MGGNRQRTNRKYLSIVRGQVVERVPEGTANAVSRVLDNDKKETVYELWFDSYDATLKDIYIEDTDYGEQCRVVLSDIGEEYVLNMPTNSSNFDSFARLVPYLKLNTLYKFKPYDFIPKDSNKRKLGLNIFEGDNKIAQFYSKENSNGLPAFPKGVGGAKPTKRDIEKWNTARIEFLVNSTRAVVDKWNGALGTSNNSGGEPSDLPF